MSEADLMGVLLLLVRLSLKKESKKKKSLKISVLEDFGIISEQTGRQKAYLSFHRINLPTKTKNVCELEQNDGF